MTLKYLLSIINTSIDFRQADTVHHVEEIAYIRLCDSCPSPRVEFNQSLINEEATCACQRQTSDYLTCFNSNTPVYKFIGNSLSNYNLKCARARVCVCVCVGGGQGWPRRTPTCNL